MSSKETTDKLDALFHCNNRENKNLAEVDMIDDGFSKILCESSQRILQCKKQTKNIKTDQGNFIIHYWIEFKIYLIKTPMSFGSQLIL